MTSKADGCALEPMVGIKGLAALLTLDFEVKLTTFEDLRLPRCDKFCDNRPLWHTANVVAFGEQNGILRTAREDLVFDDPQDLWSKADIAEFFDVPIETVRQRWRAKYTYAVERELEPPPSALWKEDFEIEGVVLWYKDTILRWGVATGKLNADFSRRERRGNRWIDPSPRDPAPSYVDPLQSEVDSGALMTYATIAARCGVREKTVKTWHNSRSWNTEFKLGKDFPEADGPVMDNKEPTWLASTIDAWLEDSYRDGDGKRENPHGTGQRQRRDSRWFPASVLSWATEKGKRWRPDADLVCGEGDGWNRDDIARIFGVSPETARQWIYQTQHGFPDPDLGDPIRRRKPVAAAA